jgi:hypothetical protein
MNTKASQLPRPSIFMRSGIVLLLVLAGAWIWIQYCLFSINCWNDVRLVPAFMAAAGEPVYSPAGQGVVSTWIYGPVPLWVLRPATWMPDIVSASLMAAAINVLVQLIVIAVACAYWPAPGANRWHRLFAFALVIAAWPEAAWRFIQADNYAVSFGLLSALLLVHVKGHPWVGWCAAVAAAAAVACKQTAVAIPLAHLIWLAVSKERTELRDHAFRLLAAGSATMVITLTAFDAAGLWFNLVTLPASLPFTDDIGERIFRLLPHLLIQLGLPVLFFYLTRKRPDPKQARRLALILWLCCMILGGAAIFTIGGSINSLQGFQIVLPALALACSACLNLRPIAATGLLIATGAALVLRAWSVPYLNITPKTDHLRQGVELAKANAGRAWFPWNPMVTYYAEGKFYHAEDGFYVRLLANRPAPMSQARAHLPSNFHFTAEPIGHHGWGISESLLIAPYSDQTMGIWHLRVAAKEPAQ